ncbi:baculoviral IAP repeat-containing protein 3-like isoform X1 [Lethenteron reissneri]|uniref:baculoviral IAP repeat-containing protein 3-like isoform X1 n=2 Tax=Lethenteron reissneri TaxID=7753 RepID=UPI002AB79752|nr:baculoviral IAP repeat-containing protein 3-like isoform X1 [Lethenteron reissneri]XP_061436878.1 baculoviral IAP repeat-containing protein 3-like isoform X1 [Lethenteron reissneri]XP_061436880.1 baculoviral IAP repeat-containing protein 3-like isoform X1 [Lethenteron reissneri]
MSRVIETRAFRRASAARRPAPPVSRSDRIPPPPSASEMHAEAARLLSFSEGWPESSPVRSADLARAGLYRVGPDDLVACFRCGGMMHRWKAGDDPVREHARHFPACALKAQLPGQTPQSTTAEIEHASPSVEELLDKLEERLSCKVCMEHEVSIIFTPCRHVVTCGHCALSLSECPVCRVAVRRALRAIMA